MLNLSRIQDFRVWGRFFAWGGIYQKVVTFIDTDRFALMLAEMRNLKQTYSLALAASFSTILPRFLLSRLI